MTTTQVQPEVTAPAEVVAGRKVIDLSDRAVSVDAAIKRFNDAKSAVAQFKAVQDDAEADLRAMLGDAEAIKVNGVERVQVQHRVNTNYLASVLVEAFPEAAEAARKVTPYTFIKAV